MFQKLYDVGKVDMLTKDSQDGQGLSNPNQKLISFTRSVQIQVGWHEEAQS